MKQGALFTCQPAKQGYGHDGLAQAHLVCQDAVQAPPVDGHQPVQADVLVLPEAALEQERHLLMSCIWP